MPLVARPHPPAMPHGELREVLPDVFFVTGSLAMPGPVPLRFSRNMTVLREGERLVVVNSVRLDDAGLAALDKLGKVTDVIRIAGAHGMDDPFYAERYGAKVWAMKGQQYTQGLGVGGADTYYAPHVEFDADTKLPVEGASVYRIGATVPEGLLVIAKHGGVIVAGDCLQNWGSTDEYFSWIARPMMRAMGFIKPHNVGPAWFKNRKPPLAEMRGILELTAANVLPAHGAPVLGGGLDLFRPAIERVAPR